MDISKYNTSTHYQQKHRGFTIVELLIVIVVIAILATITIVAFNGMSTTAKESALKTDLMTLAKQIELQKSESGSYPTSITGLKQPEGMTIIYTSRSSTSSYCVSGTSTTSPGISYQVTQQGTIEAGACQPELAIQDFTRAQCDALPVYTGSNTNAIRELIDQRGGVKQYYEIGRLADNNCWMLSNLKLGSTEGSLTATSSQSDITTNFNIPRITRSSSSNYSHARTYGPIINDTGTGNTNYGYLYNWPSATATSNASLEAGQAAPNSICARNWRLPTISDTQLLNAKMNNPSATEVSANGGSGYYQNWLSTGPFKGLLTGTQDIYNTELPAYQGVYGFFWTSTSGTPGSMNSFVINLSETNISWINAGRGIYAAVRCLLK